MNNIFEIKFSFERKMNDEFIKVFATKQGGDFNVFTYYWQSFAWAAIIGFLKDKRIKLQPPIADRPFNLNTMRNNNGDKIVKALLCLVISKSKTLDILKTPEDAINIINEYANGGYYYIQNVLENDVLSNDLEFIKQEIFSR